MDEKKNKWLKPLVIVVVIAVAAYLAYRKIYDMLFGGAVAVSIEDVYSTLNAIKVPLIIAGIVIVAAVIVSISVTKKELSIKKMVRGQSVLASVLVVAVAANVICLKTEYSLINKVMTGSDGLSDETKQASLDLCEEISEEGVVLLKNEEQSLPISKDTKLNVFGWGSTQPIYGGTGSGSVSEESAVSLLQGLENAGFEINTALTDFYTEYRADRPSIGMGEVDWTSPQPTMKEYDEKNIFEEAKDFSDTAVVVITRAGGEGPDLPEKMSTENTYNTTQMGGEVTYSTNEEDLGSDKSYLELTARETEMVERVNENFDHVYVIINSANTMELGWLNEYENIKAALWCGGAGETGFNALGSILCGDVNPSGKLADTYVYDLMNTPTYNNFGNFEYTNSDEITGSVENKAKFVNYVEGIYVGYKYYETAAAEGVIDYDSVVQYPFGYGLSYTTFEKEITNIEDDGTTVTLEVTVKNTGDTAGKDVVEIYYTPPYYNGGIEKASTNLLDFEKTELLEPGDSETISISFKYEDMSSYDDLNNKSYVLEHGDYMITLNSDSHTVLDSEKITVEKDIIYNDEHDGKRSTDEIAATNQFDYARGDVTYLSRKDGFANYDEAVKAPENVEMTETQMKDYQCKNTYDASAYDDPDAEMPATGADNGMAIQDMKGLDYEDEKWEELLDQLTVDEMTALVADGGFHMIAVDSVDAAESTACDGPAGISSNFNSSISGVAYPPAVVIASTWNKDLAQARGEQVGKECKELGVTGWYGPAMNTHRSAFAGRNFEYYSEDGTLAGIIGGKEVSGATSQGVICYVKHFALNDQETNRTNGICTWATEQSIREIYLKAFEKAFKEGNSMGCMSSFNSIGTQWAGSCQSLLQTVLREEWGFHGAVITDAMDPLADFYMDLNRGIRSGLTQGLSMTGGDGLIADTDDANTVIALREAAHENLYALANSNAMDKENGTPGWVKVFIGVDVLLAVILAGCEVLLFRNYKKRRESVTITVK